MVHYMKIGSFMKQNGFTLIELMLVLVILALLAGVATPIVTSSIMRAKEAALKENVYIMRRAIDDYYTDNGAYPKTLDILVEKRYLRFIPIHPVTGKVEWKLEFDEEDGIVDINDTYKAE